MRSAWFPIFIVGVLFLLLWRSSSVEKEVTRKTEKLASLFFVDPDEHPFVRLGRAKEAAKFFAPEVTLHFRDGSSRDAIVRTQKALESDGVIAANRFSSMRLLLRNRDVLIEDEQANVTTEFEVRWQRVGDDNIYREKAKIKLYFIENEGSWVIYKLDWLGMEK